MNFSLCRSRLSASTLLVLAFAHLALAQQNGILQSGNARITVITPNLIRIEYDPQHHFVDDRSLFAINRDAHVTFDVDGGNSWDISTGAIELSFPQEPT